MLKKTVVSGFILILIGGGLFEWTRRQPPPLHQLFPEAANIEIDSEALSVGDLGNYQNMDQLLAGIRSKPHDEIVKEQRIRLIAKIEQLASSEGTPEPILAESLYGPNWQAKVTEYKRLMAQKDLIVLASIALGIMGIIAVVLTILYVSFRLVRLIGVASMQSVAARRKKEASTACSDEVLDTKPASQDETWLPTEAPKHPPLVAGQNTEPLPLKAIKDSETDFLLPRQDAYCSPQLGFQREPEEETKFDLFLTDQESVHTHTVIAGEHQSWQQRPGPGSETTATSSLEKRTDDVARQITQVQKLVTGDMTQTALMTEPFGETLHQLNDQISAIRQYASSQQDRVEKLQNGYDWNIIRTFCLRIIRCIDNLDARIERLSDESVSVEMLCDIRDELLFSLESSGVEQFDLERDSVFCGQERLAEAIKEKELHDDPELKGRIAQVVKPGYQYVLDDENVKIVRTARVKLYD